MTYNNIMTPSCTLNAMPVEMIRAILTKQPFRKRLHGKMAVLRKYKQHFSLKGLVT